MKGLAKLGLGKVTHKVSWSTVGGQGWGAQEECSMAKGGHVMVWGWPWLVGAPHGTNESSHDLLAPISRHKHGIATHDTMCTTCAICQLLLFALHVLLLGASTIQKKRVVTMNSGRMGHVGARINGSHGSMKARVTAPRGLHEGVQPPILVWADHGAGAHHHAMDSWWPEGA